MLIHRRGILQDGISRELVTATGSTTARTLADWVAAGAYQVATLAALKALDVNFGMKVVAVRGRTADGDGYEGLFRWDSSNLSAKVTLDTTSAIYAAPDSASTGASGAWVRVVYASRYDAHWFGLIDGVADDVQINAAITVVGGLETGAEIMFRAQTYYIANTVNLGNGSTSAVSTINGISLIGKGSESAINLYNSGSRRMTRFLWTGSANGRVVDIAGPCQGNDIESVLIDGAGTAGYGLRLLSASGGLFRHLHITGCKTKVLELGVQHILDATLDSAGVQYAIRSCSDNIFISTDLNGYTAVTTEAPICLYIDGWDSGLNDTTKNTFIATRIAVNLNNNVSAGRAGVGIYQRFCDSNGFTDTWIQGLGTPSSPTTASWLYLEGVSLGGANYPVNNTFSGKLQRGQSLKCTRDAATNSASPGGNIILPLGEVDTEIVPTYPETLDISGYHPEAVDADTAEINFINEYGLARLRDEFRNGLCNSSFFRASRGASLSAPSANTYTLDNWVIDYDGSPSGVVVSQQAFTVGQTDVPYCPRYFGRVLISSGSGMSSFSFGQRIEDVRRYSGRNVVFSAWLRVASSTQIVSAAGTQYFGSGGSSSVLLTLNSADASQTVTTTWQKFRFRFAVPSISGKTVSTANDTYTTFALALPLNTGFTLDIAEPQVEYGLCDTPWDKACRLDAIEEERCARYLQLVPRTSAGNFGHGVATNADVVDRFLPLRTRMRASSQSIVTSGTAADYQVKDYAGANGGNCTSVPSIVQSEDTFIMLRFTSTGHGLTVGSNCRLQTSVPSNLWLSSEL